MVKSTKSIRLFRMNKDIHNRADNWWEKLGTILFIINTTYEYI